MASVPQRVRRPSLGAALGLILLAWTGAVVFVLVIAADTEIGPVVFKITRNHGIHLGDLYALVAAAAAATVITLWVAVRYLLRRRRYRRSTTY